jgi:hypothetical protein
MNGEGLVRLAIATAVQLLEAQDGVLYPIAHALGADGRPAFIGAYNGGVSPQPGHAIEALRARLRSKPFHCTAVVYGIAMPDESGRNALCIEFESLDAAAETILVPFVITRPWLRSARVITYAPARYAGRNHILRSPQPPRGFPELGRSESQAAPEGPERTPSREKE